MFSFFRLIFNYSIVLPYVELLKALLKFPRSLRNINVEKETQNTTLRQFLPHETEARERLWGLIRLQLLFLKQTTAGCFISGSFLLNFKYKSSLVILY